MDFCLFFSCKKKTPFPGNGVLLGPLETGLTKFITLVSWLLGRDLNEEIDPMPDPVYTPGFGELWAALALGLTPCSRCVLLSSVQERFQSPFATDSCDLLGLPSLTQHHKCFIIYFNSSFTSLFQELQRILLTS